MCLHACDRDLFYQDPVLFGSQDSVDTLIDAAAVVIQVPRSQLHVVGAHVYRRWKRVWIFDPWPDPTWTPVTRWPDPVPECLELRDYFEHCVASTVSPWSLARSLRVILPALKQTTKTRSDTGSVTLTCDLTRPGQNRWPVDLWPEKPVPTLMCNCVYIDIHLQLARILDCYLH